MIRIWQKIADTEDGYDRNEKDIADEDKHKLNIARIQIHDRLMNEVEEKMRKNEDIKERYSKKKSTILLNLMTVCTVLGQISGCVSFMYLQLRFFQTKWVSIGLIALAVLLFLLFGFQTGKNIND